MREVKLANMKRDENKQLTPSLSKVAWRFGRTRFIISLFLVMLAMVFQFLGPVKQISF